MAYVDTQFLKKILAYDCETTILVPVRAPHIPVWSGCAEHAAQQDNNMLLRQKYAFSLQLLQVITAFVCDKLYT